MPQKVYQSIPSEESETVHKIGPFACKSVDLQFLSIVSIVVFAAALLVTVTMVFYQGSNSNQGFSNSSSSCRNISPPYLYLTVHSGNSVVKYSTDGCLLDLNILNNDNSKGKNIFPFSTKKESFRSMLIGTYMDQPNVLLLAADTGDPQLVIYGSCSEESSTRNFLVAGVNKKATKGTDHAYGIAQDPDNNVYISFQHTDVVIRFKNTTLQPMDLPSSLEASNHAIDYYNGTFYQFGRPGKILDKKDQGIRSIAAVGSNLWIAYEDLSQIRIVSFNAGALVNTISIANPIGLFYDPSDEQVYVGGKKGTSSTGLVYAIDVYSLKIKQTFEHLKCQHPAGLAKYNNTLYVACHHINKVIRFDTVTGEYIDQIISITSSDKDSRIEQLTLSMC